MHFVSTDMNVLKQNKEKGKWSKEDKSISISNIHIFLT